MSKRRLYFYGSPEEMEQTFPSLDSSTLVWCRDDQPIPECDPDGEVVIGDTVSSGRREVLLLECMARGWVVRLIPSTMDLLLRTGNVVSLNGAPLLSMDFRQISRTVAKKRFFDLVVSVVALVALVPLFLLIGLAILLTDGRPVLFKQTRCGQSGTEFTILKFRSMVRDAEKESGPVFSGRNDPRVTWIGKILRQTRLDELPQLWNVVKGEMSLVGPRPERLVFFERSRTENPTFAYRLLMRPGITGLAQVEGYYDSSTTEKLRYDLMYVSRSSIWLDFMILLKTVRVVFLPDRGLGRKKYAGLKAPVGRQSTPQPVNE